MWNLNTRLGELEAEGRPIRVGLIGAGRFGTMILAQIVRMQGMRVAVVADASGEQLSAALKRAGVEPEAVVHTDSSSTANDAIGGGKIVATEDSTLAIESDVDVVVEATGLVEAGARHAHEAILHDRHVVMVNVETDVLVGPMLARLAEQAGRTYTLAYGDQPALVKELYDWATALGYEVMAAGKGTKFSPSLRKSTPDTVWELYGHTEEEVERAGLNPTMYNPFLDGTKSAVEMVSVSNMTGLVPDVRGMHFPPVPTTEIPSVLCPQEHGGILSRRGVVEVVSSTYYDGRPVAADLRWGVYVVVTSDSSYLTRIHRRTAFGTALEEAIGCSSESGIMVLEQKPARKQGAPNRCRHRTIPTVSASSLTTIAWWPMPACSCRPPSPGTWACGNSSTITLTSAARRDGRTLGTRC